jgi:7-keto-8-aminopelargonate synthetase-like enzyme
MALSFFTRNKKALQTRCRDDYATKMRLKYAPYYHAMEAQRGTTVKLDGRDMIMLSSNDYLGLSFHPRVIEAGRAAMLKWGTSTTGARTSNGSRSFHVELEEKLAEFLGREACHIHVAGYLSCLSSVAAFAQKGDVILADKNIHSCLWDGIRLSMATVERFSHNNPDDLREVIGAVNPEAAKMLVIEGVYSMEGHIARLPEIAEIADENGCFTVLDDAHGFGVLGRQGRGTVDHFALNDKVDVVCGSMSKSLASTGGFVAASSEVIEYLRTHSKQTIFSAAISPSQAAQVSRHAQVARPRHLGERDARRADRARLEGARVSVLEGAPRQGRVHRHVDRARRARRQGSHPHRDFRDAHRRAARAHRGGHGLRGEKTVARAPRRRAPTA